MARFGLLICGLIVIACASCERRPQSVSVEFRIAETQPNVGLEEKIFSGWGMEQKFYLHDEVLLTESDIASASVVTLRENPAVEVILSAAGRAKLARLTEENVGKRLGMVVDGELVCAPTIKSPITVGKAIIEGDFSAAEASRIADALTRK